jgi:hypothetical protein
MTSHVSSCLLAPLHCRYVLAHSTLTPKPLAIFITDVTVFYQKNSRSRFMQQRLMYNVAPIEVLPCVSYVLTPNSIIVDSCLVTIVCVAHLYSL